MRRWPSRIRLLAICVAAVAVLAYFLLSTPPVDDSAAISSSEEAIARGAYLVNAGGCVSCHLAVNEDGSTDSALLSAPTKSPRTLPPPTKPLRMITFGTGDTRSPSTLR